MITLKSPLTVSYNNWKRDYLGDFFGASWIQGASKTIVENGLTFYERERGGLYIGFLDKDNNFSNISYEKYHSRGLDIFFDSFSCSMIYFYGKVIDYNILEIHLIDSSGIGMIDKPTVLNLKFKEQLSNIL